jgi:CubicO group peptidase (beta-lactamase class C family)
MISLNKNFLFLLLFSFLINSCADGGDDSSDPNNNDNTFVAFIEDEMDDQNIPALSSLIFRENEILEERYFGTAHIGQGRALTADDLFLLASISKTITATGLLQLYEQGLFSLDDKINDFLSFSVNVPNTNTPITFRMLLAHTSGIADGSALDDQYYYGEDSPVELDYFLENYLVPGGAFYNATENFHDFEPGSQHEYSNEGNALLAVLVEQISGMGFNTYCKQHIFEPLGMTSTAWRLDEITGPIVQPYDYIDGENEEIQHYTFTDYPNGGLRTTTKDMFYFLRAFVQNGMSNNHQLLKATTIQEMTTLQIPALSNEMGLHLFYINSEYNLWGHDGGEQGVATIMAFDPVTKIGAIILTNQGEADLEEILVEAIKHGSDL